MPSYRSPSAIPNLRPNRCSVGGYTRLFGEELESGGCLIFLVQMAHSQRTGSGGTRAPAICRARLALSPLRGPEIGAVAPPGIGGIVRRAGELGLRSELAQREAGLVARDRRGRAEGAAIHHGQALAVPHGLLELGGDRALPEGTPERARGGLGHAARDADCQDEEEERAGH